MANKYMDSNGLLYFWKTIQNDFVAKEEGKGLSTNDYTVVEKEKLSGIENNANNYTLPIATDSVIGGIKVGSGLGIKDGILSVTGGGVADAVYWENVLEKPAWIGDTKPTYTKSEVGLSNVTNDEQVKRVEMGVANGVATLDSAGQVPSSQLPSYVDDVIEGYYYNEQFYTDLAHTQLITGESGKIYVDLSEEGSYTSYRYGGSAYTKITSGDMIPISNAEIDAITGGIS